jgi:hypothetical protein
MAHNTDDGVIELHYPNGTVQLTTREVLDDSIAIGESFQQFLKLSFEKLKSQNNSEFPNSESVDRETGDPMDPATHSLIYGGDDSG